MFQCLVPGCNGKKNAGHGYCLMHYQRLKKYGDPFTLKIQRGRECSFPSCGLKHYAKGYCRKHYAIFLRRGTPEYKFLKTKHCIVKGCDRSGKITKGYCGFHYQRLRGGIPFEAPPHYDKKGENNCNWNGGTSDYPNHYEMKKVRKVILAEANYICFYCGGKADRIHHLDHSKTNHSKENLVASCHRCNMKQRIKTGKKRRAIQKQGK